MKVGATPLASFWTLDPRVVLESPPWAFEETTTRWRASLHFSIRLFNKPHLI